MLGTWRDDRSSRAVRIPGIIVTRLFGYRPDDIANIQDLVKDSLATRLCTEMPVVVADVSCPLSLRHPKRKQRGGLVVVRRFT